MIFRYGSLKHFPSSTPIYILLQTNQNLILCSWHIKLVLLWWHLWIISHLPKGMDNSSFGIWISLLPLINLSCKHIIYCCIISFPEFCLQQLGLLLFAWLPFYVSICLHHTCITGVTSVTAHLNIAKLICKTKDSTITNHRLGNIC